MTRRYLGHIAGGVFALYAATAAAAFAQGTPPPVDQPGDHHDARVVMMHHGDHEMGPGQKGMAHRDPAAHLRAVLQLKPAQEPALTAFLAAMKPPEHEHEHMMMDMDDKAAPKTTPERLALMEKRMAEHEASMHAHLDAVRKFYDQLDPAQKRAFDELAPMMMADHMGRGHMMEGKHHMMGAKHHMPPAPPAPPHPPT
jgi:hypothetical protein